MPETLPVSCCHSAPDFHISSPAKSFFKKAAAALFGGKKDKAKYYENISKFSLYLTSALLISDDPMNNCFSSDRSLSQRRGRHIQAPSRFQKDCHQ